jgi:predicted GIY-YIG superfamily endonuclease
MLEHRDGRGGGFTKKYGVTKLVWFQDFTYVEDAIQREKNLKRWLRAWKISLIEQTNPDWHDLFPAMQKYGPKGPLSGARVEMGPRVGAVGLPPAGLPEDDT